jgi:hypothetical protein
MDVGRMISRSCATASRRTRSATACPRSRASGYCRYGRSRVTPSGCLSGRRTEDSQRTVRCPITPTLPLSVPCAERCHHSRGRRSSALRVRCSRNSNRLATRQDDSFRVSLRNLVGDCAVKSRAAWEAVRRLVGVPEASRLGCAHSAAPVSRRQLYYLLRHGRRRPVLPRRLARTLTAERSKIQSSKVIRRTGHGQAKRADA